MKSARLAALLLERGARERHGVWPALLPWTIKSVPIPWIPVEWGEAGDEEQGKAVSTAKHSGFGVGK